MTPFERHLRAAAGFLELGMLADAEAELEQIEPEMRTLSEVLAVRVLIYQALGNWEPMRELSRQLCHTRSEEAQWHLTLAYATRRCRSLQEALEVLVQAAMLFPQEPVIFYNLACYQAQLGYLDAARGRLREAIALDPAWRAEALQDSDLAALHEELRRLPDSWPHKEAPPASPT